MGYEKSEQNCHSQTELRDNDGMTETEIRDHYREHYGELSDRELDILLHVHDHSKCATGIWLQLELSDLEALVNSYVTQAEQEAYMGAYRILLNPDYTEIMRLDLILKLGGESGIISSGSTDELKKGLK